MCPMTTKQSTPNKRRGLRKLECECGAFVYTTWAQAERHGMPTCPCGGQYMPEDVELAMALALESAPVVGLYESKLSSVGHGQAWTGNYGARPADQTTYEYIEGLRKDRAKANRLNALRPAAEPMPF